ncbi:hypothetical protein T10_11481 [Trichinella papuae]|uniref:Uncharacterized protein n=1 Tax=Trichinella papuae TaxID=268474 RepID=A0A0V1N6Q5_9BILA|nr:hypothetical protein T10_11481 [Trichinella papuae]
MYNEAFTTADGMLLVMRFDWLWFQMAPCRLPFFSPCNKLMQRSMHWYLTVDFSIVHSRRPIATLSLCNCSIHFEHFATVRLNLSHFRSSSVPVQQFPFAILPQLCSNILQFASTYPKLHSTNVLLRLLHSAHIEVAVSIVHNIFLVILGFVHFAQF